MIDQLTAADLTRFSAIECDEIASDAPSQEDLAEMHDIFAEMDYQESLRDAEREANEEWNFHMLMAH